MITPALRNLRKKHPDATISVATDFPDVFEGNPFVNEVVPGALIEQIRADYDLVIDFRYEHCYPLRKHIIEIFCDCAGVSLDAPMLDLFLTQQEIAWGEREVEAHGGRAIVIQPWPGDWTRNKDWPEDRWAAAVEHLQGSTTPSRPVLQIGLADQPLIGGAIDYRGRTSIRQACALIRASDLLVSCNSFGQQAARAVGTPAVILYGSTAPIGSGYEDQICIAKPIPCGPCYLQEPCPFSTVECMSLISVGDVVSAARRLLDAGSDCGDRVDLVTLPRGGGDSDRAEVRTVFRR
jgi:ADP-heptose:LPS heptosyltransferase